MYVDYKEVGKRIAARRKALGLKQCQVNEMAELSDKYLSNIETARSIPSIDVLMRICSALKTTPDELLTGAVTSRTDSELDQLICRKISALDPKKKSFLYGFIDWLAENEM